MNTQTSTRNYRIFLLPAIIALLMNLVIGPLAPVFQQGGTDVFGAMEFTNDEQGANDQPGQKDLTRLGIDYAGLPTSVHVIFNLDDIEWSGENSGDGCSLFDTDDDLNVNFALCATVKGSPAALVSVTLYACEQDAKVDRCTGPTLLTQSAGTTCTAAIQATDPFDANAEDGPGDFFPDDAVVDCIIALADVGATDAELVNVCSYPSQEPNSDPSDCVLIIRDGAIQVVKDLINDNGGTATCGSFSFDITPGAISESFDASCSNLIPVVPTDPQDPSTFYEITEDAAPGYATTYDNCADLQVDSGETEVCTITNNDIGATLTVEKDLTNDDGGTLECVDFSFSVNGAQAVAFDASCSNTMNVNAGTYNVTEPAVAGYATTYTNCSDVLIGLGGNATCTIHNDDQAGSLTVTKIVNGGNLTCAGFSFSVNGGAATAFDAGCSNVESVAAGDYTVTEPLVAGYTTTYTNSENASANCDALAIENNGSATCTITNTRDTGQLTVIKDLSPANDPGKFNLQVDGATAGTGANVGDGGTTGALTLDTGSYDVGETAGTATNLGNYASTIECVDEGGQGVVVADGAGAGPLSVDVGKDDDIVCTITNTRVIVGFDKANDQGDNAAVAPGETIHYELTVTVNDGMATGVVVTDTLPAGLTYVADSADPSTGFSIAGQQLTWNVGSLAEGVHTFEYDATVNANATGVLTNLGCVDADQNDALVCDQTTVRVPTLVTDKVASTETITISGPANAPVATPSVVTWTISYTLTNGPVTGAVIKDAVPTGFTFLDAANGGTFANGEVTWNLGTLTASGSVSFRTTVNPATISRTGPTVNTAIIDSNETTPDNGQDSVTVTVVPPPLGGTPPPLPNTATGIGIGGVPLTVPVELLVVFFIGSLGALALANVRASSRRR